MNLNSIDFAVHECASGAKVVYYRSGFITFGFSETGVKEAQVLEFLGVKQVFTPAQIHSDIILDSKAFKFDQKPLGDGVIVFDVDQAVLIRTADCLPLFFWSDDFSCGGILHVGRSGLLAAIEKKALIMAKKVGVKPESLNFLIGPGIAGSCYQVGKEIRDSFAEKSCSHEIFTPTGYDRFLLDLKKGLILSLKEEGVEKNKIHDVGLCNHCLEDRFPSYRRQGQAAGRIFNFFMLEKRK